MITGQIYGIFHLESGRVYIGSTTNMKNRQKDHLSQLRNKRHYCAQLQEDWTKFGAAAFDFRVLENCPEIELVKRETKWMCEHKEKLYNTKKRAARRKRILDNRFSTGVTLSKKDWDYLRKLGYGNGSLGVRMLVQAHRKGEL